MMINQEHLQQLQQVLDNEDLVNQRVLIQELAADLGTDVLNCAAALLYLQQNPAPEQPAPIAIPQPNQPDTKANLLGIKMLRYRLDVGAKHQITAEQLKKLLVEESGVDSNNITSINIRAEYTIIELPDEMPMDIFQHLKSVEINQQQLAIRRLKNRNKKRNNRFRRGRQRNPLNQDQDNPAIPSKNDN